MIAKDRAPFSGSGRFEKAGDEAERQMAHYLKRAYAEKPDVYVFNDLRIERGTEVAQMDHLLLHKFGFFIIESKSVTGEIHVNPQHEFARIHNGRRTGMPSPYEQARRQGELLRSLLIDHKESLRQKRLMGLVQPSFRACPFNCLVAISDRGIITPQNRPDTAWLRKADQVTQAIDAELTLHRRAHGLTGTSNGAYGVWHFNDADLPVVSAFLLSRHVERPTDRGTRINGAPASGAAVRAPQPPSVAENPGYVIPAWANEATRVPPPPAVQRTTASATGGQRPTCTQCGSQHGTIEYGHSYYFKCAQCGKNSAVTVRCGACGQPARLRKRGAEFTATCQACGQEAAYFHNPR